ncbi:MAG: OmpA family protein [Saprospiraceae bacterium]
MLRFKKQILLLLLFCVSGSVLIAQKGDFKKADALYRVKSYAEAIPIYEKGLEKSNSRGARSKLAYSYKMLNQMKKSEVLYESLMKEKRVRADDLYNYGEVLMSQAKYDEAKSWFLKYHEREPDEGRGLQMANACDQIPFLSPIFPDAKVKAFPYNTEYDDASPVFLGEEMVFSSDRKAGIKIMKKKSGATGRDFIRLYSSSMNDQNEWSEPKSFSGKLNELNKNNANASFTTDGNEVFFTRNANESNRKNAFTLQLHSAKKEKGKWKNIEILPFCRLASNYMHPSISPDGNTLFFVSDKPGGKGGTDIYYSQRKGDKWGKAVNLDTMINTSAHEGFPFMTEDGNLYFCSKGHVGYGGYDIFVSKRFVDGSWGEPRNVGKPINSSMDDISIYLNKENTRGAFTSSRKGGDDDIYLFAMDGSISEEEVEPVVELAPVMDEGVDFRTEAEKETQVVETEIKSKAIEETEEAVDVIVETPIVEEDVVVETTENVEELVVEEKMKAITVSNTTEEMLEPGAKDKVEEVIKENTNEIPQTIVSESTLEVSDLQMETQTEKVVEEKMEDVSEVKVENTIVTETEVETPKVEVPEVEVPIVETPEVEVEPVFTETLPTEGMSPKAFKKAISKGTYTAGMFYILEEMNYQPGEYLLAPKMTLQLEPIAEMLTEQPDLQLEISIHTESIGYDENNLKISKKRAKAIKNYLLYKGVEVTRITAIGLGETKLLNHCSNGVVCEEEEHMANQRVEVRVK